MIIIGLVGTKSAGKDTFADYFIHTYSENTKIVKYAFATPLKKACKELFLLSDIQLSGTIEKETIDSRWGLSPRQMFQIVGTDFIRNGIDENFWLRHFEHWIDSQLSIELSDRPSIVLVSDVRFQNEVNLIKEKGGIIIKINRNSDRTKNDSNDRDSTTKHISESGVSHLTGIDYVIDNTTSLAGYYYNIDCFTEWLVTKKQLTF